MVCFILDRTVVWYCSVFNSFFLGAPLVNICADKPLVYSAQGVLPRLPAVSISSEDIAGAAPYRLPAFRIRVLCKRGRVCYSVYLVVGGE
jgi:hypothetical protein